MYVYAYVRYVRTYGVPRTDPRQRCSSAMYETTTGLPEIVRVHLQSRGKRVQHSFQHLVFSSRVRFFQRAGKTSDLWAEVLPTTLPMYVLG